MRRFLYSMLVVMPMAIAAPVIAQTPPGGIPPGGAGVPSPEIGVGVIGLVAAAAMVRILRNRAKR